MQAKPHEVSMLAQFFALFRLIRPFHGALAKGLMIGPLIGLLSMVPPYLTKLLFDEVALSYDVGMMSLLVAGVLAFSVTAALSEAVLHYYSSYLNIKLENTTQLHFFNHVQHLPLAFFNHRKTGEIASRFQEIKSALGSVHAVISVVFGQGIFLLLVPPFLFYLNWQLALIAILAVPMSAIVIYWLSSRLQASWQQVVQSHADMDAMQIEMLNQIATVKVMQLETRYYSQASGRMTDLLGAHMRAQTLSVSFSIFDRCISILNVGLFTWMGWYFIIDGQMSVGDYVAFTAYVGYLRTPMKEFVNLYTRFQQWAVHLNRIFEYLNHPAEQEPQSVDTRAAPPSTTRLTQGIQFCKVSFAYPSGQNVIEGISLDIKPGQVVALLGSSGSGKSTLLKLLCATETGYQGEIRFEGKAQSSWPLHALRSQLSVVWQDVELFQGSMRENLTMGAAQVTQQALDEVVELCCLSELIASLPQGYDTIITARGTTISGGQRQRVALARALLRSAPVLLLDEAMSSLDVETEARIARRLFERTRKLGQTVVFVTHRVSHAQLADSICLMGQGNVLAQGTHSELSASSAQYRQLLTLNQDVSSHGSD